MHPGDGEEALEVEKGDDINDRRLPRPTNYETALGLARERLRGLDFDERCERAGIPAAAEGAEVWFINRSYFLSRRELQIRARDDGPLPEVWEQIIILHYLLAATGAPLRNELISYQQVKDGAPYYSTFLKRTAGILVAAFGMRLERLLPAAINLGGRDVSGLGDLAVAVRALPRIEYLFVGWRGDAEFEPSVQVLFDAAIQDYLPAEDITVLGQMLCLKLVRAGK